MPLNIIRQDITKLDCDAIVNPTDIFFSHGGGLDAQIHKKAGEDLALACERLGGIEVGEAKITPAFNLPCKYVIHTVGPVWRGGDFFEKRLLQSCYENSLDLALKNDCESVAFPLISSGRFAYPKDRVLRDAVDVISKFLLNHEIDVYLVVYDKTSYEFSKQLFGSVSDYIEWNYEDKERYRKIYKEVACCYIPDEVFDDHPCACPREYRSILGNRKRFNIEEMIEEMDDTFAVSLMKLIDIKGMTDVECYKRANVSKQTWYKILNDPNYKPSKNTVIAFAISLKLNYDETQALLKTVGFTLSRSNKFDIIIEYFIKNYIYDIMTINETLFEFDQVCLGV